MASSRSTRRLLDAALAIRRVRAETRSPRAKMRLIGAELRLRAELADAVPKSAAAGFLGVSTTALERWVDAGWIPVVQRPGGREQIAAEALLDIAEEVARLREEGVSRGLLASALRRLERRGLPRRRQRPNEPAHELRATRERTTPAERLHETAELSYVATTLAGYGVRRRSRPIDVG
jgi:hypothetical protein